MSKESVEEDGKQCVATAIFMGLLFVAGNMSNAIYPVFVNALSNVSETASASVGSLATAEFLAYGLAVLFAGRFFPERNLRLIGAACLITHLVTAYATTLVSPSILIMLRLAYGAASGVLIWIVYAYIARSSAPGQLVALYTTGLMTFGVAWSMLSPDFIVPNFGHSAVFVFMTLLSLVALISIRISPNSLPPLPDMAKVSGVRSSKLQLPALVVLFSVGFFAAFNAIFWVYSDPIAQKLTGPLIPYWLTISLAFQILGAALAAVIVERVSVPVVLTLGLGVLILQMVAMIAGVQATGFVVWTAVYGFMGYFLFAFYVRAIAQMDPTNRMVTYFPAAQLLSASLGPMFVSSVVDESDLTAILSINLIVIIVAPVLYWLAVLLRIKFNGWKRAQAQLQ